MLKLDKVPLRHVSQLEGQSPKERKLEGCLTAPGVIKIFSAWKVFLAE